MGQWLAKRCGLVNSHPPVWACPQDELPRKHEADVGPIKRFVLWGDRIRSTAVVGITTVVLIQVLLCSGSPHAVDVSVDSTKCGAPAGAGNRWL
jgi:hypothetical protein